MSSVAEYVHGDISQEEYIESVRSEQMKSRIDLILGEKKEGDTE